MVEARQQAPTLHTSRGDFALAERVAYPNGGTSLFFEYDGTAIIVDDGICDIRPGEKAFDYSLITTKQNEYMTSHRRVYRFLREDVGEIERFLLADAEVGEDGALNDKSLLAATRTADRANVADASPLERLFEEHFANVYGADSARYLWREYGLTDADGHVRYLDYLVQTKTGRIAVEENGVTFHHPQIVGRDRYRTQLLKQNSCTLAGIKLYRFSTDDIRFTDRFEDDIRSFFGPSTSTFMDSGIVVGRKFELYEHQESALQEMASRRAAGTRSFLAVLPTASGKSQIVLEDLARFMAERPGSRALVMAPNSAIVGDWEQRMLLSAPALSTRVDVRTFAYMTRHYAEYAPEHYAYVVVDEAHHAVAPALKRTIQHFDPAFLVGLTATDQRPDKKRLEEVFGSYRVGLSLREAMERGIVARARAFRIETNLDLSHVRINGKDYVNADLEKRVRVTSRNELIVDVLREYFCEGAAGRRQGVVFCVNVNHAKEMARLLNRAGISASELSSQTRNPQQVMDDFRAGKTRFLCSCQMISEGWDYPELGILVMARPTLSRVLYLQQLGRGLRRTSSKSNVFVIDVVDEYGAMVQPCSLHSIFANPYYVPFGDILRRDYQPGEWVEVDGLREQVQRIVEVDALSFSEKYEGYLSDEQLARDFFVSTGTIKAWVRSGKIVPSVTFAFGSRKLALFSPDDVAAMRERLGIPVHDDSTIRDDFWSFLQARDYTMSYKMPFLLSFLDHMSPATGSADIDEVLDDYVAFYRDRLDRGLAVDRPNCPYTPERLSDRKYVRRSMLDNPFEKFERKRFLYYSRDLGQISMNHALQARLTSEDYDAIREQLRQDLEDYYRGL
ncbi:MAG: DEAD/DEAH box helicase [Coriobacteriales bacterium]|nr:DEAD/DEAH box helicase [Coriobacteriales bacterium]